MGSRYAQVDRCVWVDAKFLALSAPAPNAQTLFLWLLTSPESGLVPGLIRIGLAGMAEAIGWTTEQTSALMDELVAAGMARVDWKARLVWLPKALSRNLPRQAQNMSPWAKAWSEIPECPLKAEAWQGMFDTLASKKPELAESFEKQCPHPLVSIPQGSASRTHEAKGGAKGGAKPREDEGAKGGANPATHKQDHDHNQEQKQAMPGAKPPATPSAARAPLNPDSAAILAELQRHPALTVVADVDRSDILSGRMQGKKVEWVVTSIAEAAADVAGGSPGANEATVWRILRGYVDRARRPDVPPAPGVRSPTGTPRPESPSVASQAPFHRAPRGAP